MRKIVAGVGRKFWFPTIDDRDEHLAEALVYAISRIDRFQVGRGGGAFGYFTRLAFNRLRNQLARENLRLERGPVLFSQADCARDSGGDVVAALLEGATPYTRASR